MVKVYYRLSNFEASISKQKIPNATKRNCLQNCIKEFGVENITVIGDTLNEETKQAVEELKLRVIHVSNGSGSGTFRDALNLALEENKESDFVYLLEDDFLHLEGSRDILLEGLNKFNAYVTLYDHPDKYIDKQYGGNPFIEGGGEVTRVVTTQSIHWKITNSTVMSFAASIKRLKEDKDLLLKHATGKITNSFGFFLELANTKSIPAISCIPGKSTHCESAWLTPFVDWEKL